MLKNRSVPVDAILPHLVYEDVGGALTWLAKAFGFTEQFRYSEPGGPVQGAQMHLGGAGSCLRLRGRAEYGERHYGAEDHEGHHWLFAKHVRDVNPEEWGAPLSGR